MLLLAKLPQYTYNDFYSSVPEITASFSTQGSPVLGNSFSINCAVSNTDNLDATITYSLNRLPSGAPTTADTSSLPIVSFDAITLADAGSYQCSANVSSPFLTDNIIVLTEPPINIVLPCEFCTRLTFMGHKQ